MKPRKSEIEDLERMSSRKLNDVLSCTYLNDVLSFRVVAMLELLLFGPIRVRVFNLQGDSIMNARREVSREA